MSNNKEILQHLGKAYRLLEEQKYDAIDQEELNQHFKGSELHEQMYKLLSMNSHKVSYQLDDLGGNAVIVREWLVEYEAQNPIDEFFEAAEAEANEA